MGCCCATILNLCKQDVCDVNALNLSNYFTPVSTGIYKMQVSFLSSNYIIEKEIVDLETDELIFDISELNEYYQYHAKVFDPAGDVISFSVEDDQNVYDCIMFETAKSFAL